MSMREDYDLHKNDNFSLRDIAMGICTIASYAGAAVGFVTVFTWVCSIIVPIFAWAGAPITLGTLMFGCKALQAEWKCLSENNKKRVIAALSWIGRGTDISSWFK